MGRKERLILLMTLASLSFQTYGAELTSTDCSFKTDDKKNVFFVLETFTKPQSMDSMIFNVGDKSFTLDLSSCFKTYVRYTVPQHEYKVSCSFESTEVTLKYEVEDVDKGEDIQLPRGMSVGFVFGSKSVEMLNDKDARVNVPFSVQVIKGTKTKTKVSLYQRQPISVDMLEGKQNYLVVEKEEIRHEDSFKVDMKMRKEANIIITNLETDEPNILLASTCSLTCLSSQSCPFNTQSGSEALLLKFNILANSQSKTTLKVFGEVEEKLGLAGDMETVVHLGKEELGNKLHFSIDSDQKNIKKPVSVSIQNDDKSDMLVMKKERVKYQGKSIKGVFLTGLRNTVFHFTLPEDENIDTNSISIKTLNPLATKLSDLTKKIPLTSFPDTNRVVLLKENVNINGRVDFQLDFTDDKRSSLILQQNLLDVFHILPGSLGVVSYNRPGIIEQQNSNDITIVLQLKEDSTKASTSFQLGEKTFTVGKIPVYKYLKPEDFGEDKIFFCAPKEKYVEVKFMRFEAKVPYEIQYGKNLLEESMEVTLRFQDPTQGATLYIKDESLTKNMILVEINLNKKDKNGNEMKVSRNINGPYEEAIFIYPEDLQGVKKLTGSITFPKGKTVEVNNVQGIDKLEIESDSYYVRKNEVELNVPYPFTNSEMRIEMEDDSDADTVVFELNKKQYMVDKSSKSISVPLRETYLIRNPSPIGRFTSIPENMDAHIYVRIKRLHEA